jgi:hypothetical protein
MSTGYMGSRLNTPLDSTSKDQSGSVFITFPIVQGTECFTKLFVADTVNRQEVGKAKQAKTNLTILLRREILTRVAYTCLGMKSTKLRHTHDEGLLYILYGAGPKVQVLEKASTTALEEDLKADIGTDAFSVLVIPHLGKPEVTLTDAVKTSFDQLRGRFREEVVVYVQTTLHPRKVLTASSDKLECIRMRVIKMQHTSAVFVQTTPPQDFVESGVDLSKRHRPRSNQAFAILNSSGSKLG